MNADMVKGYPSVLSMPFRLTDTVCVCVCVVGATPVVLMSHWWRKCLGACAMSDLNFKWVKTTLEFMWACAELICLCMNIYIYIYIYIYTWAEK